jgi:hypothetical protein
MTSIGHENTKITKTHEVWLFKRVSFVFFVVISEERKSCA